MSASDNRTDLEQACDPDPRYQFAAYLVDSDDWRARYWFRSIEARAEFVETFNRGYVNGHTTTRAEVCEP